MLKTISEPSTADSRHKADNKQRQSKGRADYGQGSILFSLFLPFFERMEDERVLIGFDMQWTQLQTI